MLLGWPACTSLVRTSNSGTSADGEAAGAGAAAGAVGAGEGAEAGGASSSATAFCSSSAALAGVSGALAASLTKPPTELRACRDEPIWTDVGAALTLASSSGGSLNSCASNGFWSTAALPG